MNDNPNQWTASRWRTWRLVMGLLYAAVGVAFAAEGLWWACGLAALCLAACVAAGTLAARRAARIQAVVEGGDPR